MQTPYRHKEEWRWKRNNSKRFQLSKLPSKTHSLTTRLFDTLPLVPLSAIPKTSDHLNNWLLGMYFYNLKQNDPTCNKKIEATLIIEAWYSRYLLKRKYPVAELARRLDNLDQQLSKAECPICLNVVPRKRQVKLDCGHVICQGCLVRWRKNCPTCRAQISATFLQQYIPPQQHGCQHCRRYLDNDIFADIREALLTVVFLHDVESWIDVLIVRWKDKQLGVWGYLIHFLIWLAFSDCTPLDLKKVLILDEFTYNLPKGWPVFCVFECMLQPTLYNNEVRRCFSSLERPAQAVALQTSPTCFKECVRSSHQDAVLRWSSCTVSAKVWSLLG